MNTLENLQLLLATCKCGVSITVNGHRDYYQTAKQSLAEMAREDCPPRLEPEVRARMVETDTIVNVRFYPETPIGSYDIYHYDLDAALTEAIECLRQDGLVP